jgi:hypothetical protein
MRSKRLSRLQRQLTCAAETYRGIDLAIFSTLEAAAALIETAIQAEKKRSAAGSPAGTVQGLKEMLCG